MQSPGCRKVNLPQHVQPSLKHVNITSPSHTNILMATRLVTHTTHNNIDAMIDQEIATMIAVATHHIDHRFTTIVAVSEKTHGIVAQIDREQARTLVTIAPDNRGRLLVLRLRTSHRIVADPGPVCAV
jgi:hypothetical protein